MTATAYRRSPSAIWRRVGSEVLVSVAPNDQIHELNASAAAVWWAVSGGSDTDEVAATVASSFGVELSVIEAEVTACLRELTSLGVLERVSS